MTDNSQILFQAFHWYFQSENNLWNFFTAQAEKLNSLGITHVWLPPAYKSAKRDEPGYAVYDLYDLGEFDQKGSVGTKHGTRDEYLTCINAIQDHGIKVLADIVLNHKFDGDHEESVSVIQVSEKNRNKYVSDMHTIKAKTGFRFPARSDNYSAFHWSWRHFTGLCDEGKPKLIVNDFTIEGWGQETSKEKGNFDFLMANDIEFRNPEVRQELMRWGHWYTRTTAIDGFRLDGLKHITIDFYPQWLDHLAVTDNKEYFVIGEYWDTELTQLVKYIRNTGSRVKLFDVPLHFNLYQAGSNGDFDLRKIFKGTLTEALPDSSITFVDNHDTQPMQSLESYVEDWFQPHAYALILLRKGGIPCIFYPAVYGATYTAKNKNGDVQTISLKSVDSLPLLIDIRQHIAKGAQVDYCESKHLIGWTRSGLPEAPGSGCAVLISTGKAGEINMRMGLHLAGQRFFDATGNSNKYVTVDENGDGDFYVSERSISVWILEKKIGHLDFNYEL